MDSITCKSLSAQLGPITFDLCKGRLAAAPVDEFGMSQPGAVYAVGRSAVREGGHLNYETDSGLVPLCQAMGISQTRIFKIVHRQQWAHAEPLPADCLPAEHVIRRLLCGPQLDEKDRIIGGVYAGMTPAEVIAQRDEYRRLCGE